jgi:hypothetical protein
MLKTLKEKFNKLGQVLSLRKLQDKHLHLISKVSKVSSLLAGGHALLWVGIGVVGGVALGLHAMGLAVPAIVGTGTLIIGGVFAVKSFVFNRGLKALHKHCESIIETRRSGAKPVVPNPVPAPAAESKVSATPPLANSFEPATTNKPPETPATPPAPAPEVKPPEPPKP